MEAGLKNNIAEMEAKLNKNIDEMEARLMEKILLKWKLD